MLFAYTAKSKTGEILEGILEASDRLALAHDLRLKGNIPISISEKGKSINDRLAVVLGIFSKVSVAEQIILIKNTITHSILNLWNSRCIIPGYSSKDSPSLDFIELI